MGDLTMPSLGADMESGTLLEWLAHPGDPVRRGQPVAVVDTDKAAIEIECFEDGTLDTVLVEPGTRVAVGTPIARITSAVTAPTAAAPAGPRAPVAAPAGPPAAVPEAPGRRVSPYARRLAGELGVDLDTLTGSGAGGAVRAEDVRAAAARTELPPPEVRAPERAGPERPEAPRARAGRDTIAALMSRANRDIPHYYVATTVDMHAVTTWLRRTNRDRAVAERIVPAAAIMKATALAARAHPELNGFWQDGGFVPGEDVHLAVAVSVRGGALVAPALHCAADLELAELMHQLRDLVTRARSGRLTRVEMAEPTLTVTDLGDQGVEEVMGVIYPPQVALVGVGRMVERPWAVDGMLTVRPVVRLTLSGDHRATDGATGSRFLTTVEELLQRPEEL
jgi:pyruvate dehydrogenase E2 component (dihydrolipoamide acetyltransferase)